MADEKALAKADIISSIVLQGDLSRLTPTQKVQYYNQLCESLELNPATMPFSIMKQQNKEILYGNKNLAEQLRKKNNISFLDMQQEFKEGLVIVTVKVSDTTGRIDMDVGAVSIVNLKGDALANAIMKAITKAKRRATLSICSLGMLDETEVETIPNAETVNPITGEVTTKRAVPQIPGMTIGVLYTRAKDLGIDEAKWKELTKSCDITSDKRTHTPVRMKALAELIEKHAAAKPSTIKELPEDALRRLEGALLGLFGAWDNDEALVFCSEVTDRSVTELKTLTKDEYERILKAVDERINEPVEP